MSVFTYDAPLVYEEKQLSVNMMRSRGCRGTESHGRGNGGVPRTNLFFLFAAGAGRAKRGGAGGRQSHGRGRGGVPPNKSLFSFRGPPQAGREESPKSYEHCRIRPRAV